MTKTPEFKQAIENLKQAALRSPIYLEHPASKKQIVTYDGSDNPSYLFIGEAPGREENLQGQPFVGDAGKILRNWISVTNIRNFGLLNVIPIVPTMNNNCIRKPTFEECNFFREPVLELIKASNCKYLILLGRTAQRTILSEDKPPMYQWLTKDAHFASGKKLHCEALPEHIAVLCTYHPAYFLKQDKDGMDDFINAFEKRPGKSMIKTLLGY